MVELTLVHVGKERHWKDTYRHEDIGHAEVDDEVIDGGVHSGILHNRVDNKGVANNSQNEYNGVGQAEHENH